MTDDSDKLATARGMLIALVIALGFWAAVIAATIWMVTDGARRIHEAQIASTKLQHRMPEARP